MDKATAEILKREVSDGVIAGDYEPEALELLKSKVCCLVLCDAILPR